MLNFARHQSLALLPHSMYSANRKLFILRYVMSDGHTVRTKLCQMFVTSPCQPTRQLLRIGDFRWMFACVDDALHECRPGLLVYSRSVTSLSLPSFCAHWSNMKIKRRGGVVKEEVVSMNRAAECLVGLWRNLNIWKCMFAAREEPYYWSLLVSPNLHALPLAARGGDHGK